MDLVALMGVRLFLKRDVHILRLIISAAVFSVISAALLIKCRDAMVYTILMHFVVNTAMAIVSFSEKTATERLENWAVIYLCVIILGGLMDAAGDAEMWCAIVFSGGALYIIIRYLMRRRVRGNNIYPVSVKNKGRTIHIRGLYDSGNQLKDPYTGKCVSIISHRASREICDISGEAMRYVPYRSLGEHEGLIAVMTVDEICITDGGRRIVTEHAAVAIGDEGLMEDKEYDIILGAGIV